MNLPKGDGRASDAAESHHARADRYEYALTLLHSTGDGGFVALTRDEQAVVEDCIRVALERRAALVREADRGR